MSRRRAAVAELDYRCCCCCPQNEFCQNELRLVPRRSSSLRSEGPSATTTMAVIEQRTYDDNNSIVASPGNNTADVCRTLLLYEFFCARCGTVCDGNNKAAADSPHSRQPTTPRVVLLLYTTTSILLLYATSRATMILCGLSVDCLWVQLVPVDIIVGRRFFLS